MKDLVETTAEAIYGNFFVDEWPPKHAPDLGMGATEFREAARLALVAASEWIETRHGALHPGCVLLRRHIADALNAEKEDANG